MTKLKAPNHRCSARNTMSVTDPASMIENTFSSSTHVFSVHTTSMQQAWQATERHNCRLSQPLLAKQLAEKTAAHENRPQARHEPVRKAAATAAAAAGDLTVMLKISDMSTQKMPAQEMLNASMKAHIAPS